VIHGLTYMFSQFFPSDKSENDQFKAIVSNRTSSRYYPSFKVASALGMSGRALSRITSSFLVITGNHQKVNLGVQLKFEAKGLKVVGYSRKNDRYWEFSDKTVELIKAYKATPKYFAWPGSILITAVAKVP
jgi:hypothetical protein